MSSTGRHKQAVWALAMGCLFALSLSAADRGRILGGIVASEGVTVAGVPIPSEGTIFAGDVLRTPKGGTARVSFSPASRANIAEETSVRFGYAGANPLAQLSSGTIVTTRFDKDGLIVETPKYRVEPAEQGKAVYVVAVLPDAGTVVTARSGGVSITEISSGRRYVLPEGKYASIAAASAGVPQSGKEADDEQAAAGGMPGNQGGGGWHIGSLSHGASIAVVITAAAGATAAIWIPLALASESAP